MSPYAWRAMVIGLVHERTMGRTPETRIGLRKTVPSRMARIVPLGLFHCCLRPYSSTRAVLGVIVAHLTPTPYSAMACAASTVTWSSVWSRICTPRSYSINSTSR